MNVTPQSQCDDERIFTKSFFLIFTALLFTALVMYALMSTVTEYASSRDRLQQLQVWCLEYISLEGCAPEFIPQMH